MKRILSFVIAMLLLLSLCACQSSQKNAAPMLAFVHRAGEDAYTAALAESFSKTAKQLGYDCTAVRPENDSADAQIALIEDLIKRGVRGIALNANQSEGLEDVLKKAADANIPVITLPADTKGSKLLVRPSSPQLMGIALMDAMLELTGGEGEFVVHAGESVFSGSDPWVRGMETVAKDEKYKTLTWVQTSYGANAEAAKVLSGSRVSSMAIVSNAEAYKYNVATVAQADAARFKSQLTAYRTQPKLFRLRTYLDFLDNDCKDLRKYVISSRIPSQIFEMNMEENPRLDLLNGADINELGK